jgi:hypothetical protein
MIGIQGPDLLRRLGLWEKHGAREWSLARLISTPISKGEDRKRYDIIYPKVIHADHL